MNSKERLHRCYTHQELDRPGVYVRTNWPPDDPSYDEVKTLLNQHSDRKTEWYFPRMHDPEHVVQRSEPFSDDFEREVTTLHAPAGQLRSTFLRSLHGRPGLAEEYLLKDRRDAEVYLSLDEPAVGGVDASSFFALEKGLGDRGIMQIMISHCPGAQVVELFGQERFAIMSVTDRDVLHELCRRKMETYLAKVNCCLEAGMGPYFGLYGEEYLVPPMAGPADFADFMVRYDQPIIDLVHASGGWIHMHCHGSVRKVLPLVVEAGVNVLHPFEAPPMGDITAAQAKQASRGQVCLEGNIQIADMYEKTSDHIRRQTEALIRECFDDRRGLIVCPTASLYQRGKGAECLPQVEAMLEAVLGFSA